jgi:tripartite-type tricarboxylate transporter receptor subunit TctC
MLISEIIAVVKRSCQLALAAASPRAEKVIQAARARRLLASPIKVISLAVSLLFLFSDSTSAQAPRTIKIIVPSSAGGGADILARLLADQISRQQGVAVVVENRPGASNTIGTEIVSRAAPDGSTLLISTPEFVINSHLRKLNYDPLTSFTPICYLVRSQQVLAVNSASPYRTLDDLLNAARTQPDEITLASAGPGSSTHIALEMLKRAANVKTIYVPYQGSTSAVNALLGGYVTAALASYPNMGEHIRAGKLRALATTSSARIPQLSNVPTVAEAGFQNYGSDIWFGIVAPARTPKPIILQLVDWFSAALAVPELEAKLEMQGLSTVGVCGDEFGVFLRQQYDATGRAIRETNIGAQ